MNIPSEFEGRINIGENGCWNWTGWVAPSPKNSRGDAPYGVLQRNNKRIKAHRYFFELAYGIELGRKHVHHKCRNTLCVNPEHLEMVDQSDHNRLHNLTTHPLNLANLAREACKYGHPWSDETTYWHRGTRHCRQCNTETMRRWREVRGLTGKPRTHCSKGHPYTGDNFWISPQGHRRCRICNRESSREAQRRKRQRERG